MNESTANIPAYSLFINPKDLQELNRDIWRNEHVPAQLKTNQNSFKIEIAYRGALTRELPKKSYHILFKKPGRFLGGREIHLNAEYLDPSLLRNKLSFDFFRDLNILSPAAKFVLLKLNGSFKGVYLHLESVDDLFLKNRNLPAGAIYYARNDDANFSLLNPDNYEVKKSLLDGYKQKYGSPSDDGFLRELIFKTNTVPRADFAKEIVKHIDIEKYLRWLAGVVCTQNYDGFIQNYALYRNSVTGLFELIPWDYDGTWGRSCHGKEMAYHYVPIQGSNTLTARILDIPAFRHSYRRLLEEILETSFTRNLLEPRITSLYHLLRPHIPLDPYKKDDIEGFDAEPEYIIRFIVNRNHYLKEQFVALK
ncbi:CotH kinase family protein [Desulfotomaculum sp. 1211_IL3151]|uniref:CotH kinase family protein n=1 Tax=Desulfotomaculum sp. 1211_IL3151 TaxID=3084055 RepID=UPI002FD9247F